MQASTKHLTSAVCHQLRRRATRRPLTTLCDASHHSVSAASSTAHGNDIRRHHSIDTDVNATHCSSLDQGSARPVLEKQTKPLPGLIIFDKNGTLINFHAVWTPWIQGLTKRLEAVTGLKLQQEIFKELDFCHFTNKTRHGLLASGTSSQIKRELETVLHAAGLDWRSAQLTIEHCWQDIDDSDPEKKIKTETDLTQLFNRLRLEGIKIAICTSDSRRHTESTLDNLNLTELVDEIVCGDDVNVEPMSGGACIQQLCKKLGVEAGESVMVGDTRGDLEMGCAAGVGLTLGVLSGIGTRLDLAPVSDRVIANVNTVIPLLIKGDVWRKKKEANKTSKTEKSSEETITDTTASGQKAELVIFDKDGTLLCFNSMWTPWAEQLIKRLEVATGLELKKKVFDGLGYCHESKRWTPGVLAEGTADQNQQVIISTLVEEGLTKTQAGHVLEECWREGNHSEGEDLKPVDNPMGLFSILKKHGVKIAVCTADSREPTVQFLETIKANEYVDMVMCGDDENNVPKPAPNNALHICETLNVDPSKCVVVGDTEADLGMGRSAELGATIGVLTGVGRVKDLDAQADHIVPSIKHMLPIVLPDIPKHQTS